MVVFMLNEDKKSQISSGHRLIRLVQFNEKKLYTNKEFNAKAIYISADFWLHSFLPNLKINISNNISNRISAAISRARKNIKLYDVDVIGIPELISEALFDTHWYKVKDQHISRLELRDKVLSIINKNQKIQLYLPILSRKPFSPIKNKGTLPDLSELHTLARCAEAAYTINALSPTGCEFIILADGFKYNRACGTPNSEIELYQLCLKYWMNILAIHDVVKLENYENWVNSGLSEEAALSREIHFRNKYNDLKKEYDLNFNINKLDESLDGIAKSNEIGDQLRFTFWSIVSSVYYQELFNLFDADSLSFIEHYYNDDIQELYSLYLTSLNLCIHEHFYPDLSLNKIGYLPSKEVYEIFIKMRKRAWESAMKYVAISLTDRELNTLEVVKESALKLTIHGKKGEIHFVSTTKQDVNITAQHCCGGLDFERGNTKLSFKYRLERELKNEIPILIENLEDTPYNRAKYGNFLLLYIRKQPICYVSNVTNLKKKLMSMSSLHRE